MKVTVYLHVAPAEVWKTWSFASIPSYDPHDAHCNFILVFILVHILLFFLCFQSSCFILDSPSVIFLIVTYLSLFHASCPCMLSCTVHVPTLVAALSMDMSLTVDHSSLGHDVMHLGKQIPTFWKNLLFVFRVNMNSWMTFLAVTQRGLINRQEWFKGTRCFRLLHRRWKQ